MLTKHTYSVLVLIAALAVPALAVAAPQDDPAPRIGLGEAEPAAVHPIVRPVQSFHRTIRVTVRRIRAAERAKVARIEREKAEAFAELPGGVSRETLESIASCESGGDPTIVSADGSYRGKYQFSTATWAGVGGSGDPAAASEAEQDYRAALLYARSGPGQWPVCGL